MAAIPAFLMFVGIILFFKGLSAPKEEDSMHQRLTLYGNRPPSLEELEMGKPFSERVMKPIIQKLAGLMQSRTPEKTLEQIRQNLDAAGNPNNLTVLDFLGIKGFAALAVAGIAFLLLGDPMMKVLGVIGGGFIGSKLPDLWLGSKAGARKKEMVLSLPDVLDLLTISVEAGMGFEQAMSKVAAKWDNALTREFDRALREQRMGMSRRESLRALALRCNTDEVSTFTSAIIQADQLGVSISRILQIQSQQMRIKRRQKAEKLAAQAPLKMTFPMVLFLQPALWLVILGPMWPYFATTGQKAAEAPK